MLVVLGQRLLPFFYGKNKMNKKEMDDKVKELEGLIFDYAIKGVHSVKTEYDGDKNIIKRTIEKKPDIKLITFILERFKPNEWQDPKNKQMDMFDSEKNITTLFQQMENKIKQPLEE